MSRSEAANALLERVAREHAPAVLASSLGAEDLVLTDLIARHRRPIGIFTLDTGRLHGDTLAMIERIRRHYRLVVRVVQPEDAAVADFVLRHGRNGIYRSVELRRQCCHIRKVEPLRRALAGQGAWITGLRREQSASRTELAIEEFDATHGIPKFNPLADWTEKDVWAYIREHSVPYNPLYDQGYRSIGCAPCTRPVLPTEDPRSGRWWWETNTESECGLHVARGQPLERARPQAA